MVVHNMYYQSQKVIILITQAGLNDLAKIQVNLFPYET